MAPQSTFVPGSLFASWTFDYELSEDCLAALNVWTPGLRDRARRPVIVCGSTAEISRRYPVRAMCTTAFDCAAAAT
jgi:hypothetical protein